MDKPRHENLKVIDLGRASQRTLGATGPYPDFVRTMEHWGIARD